MERESASGGTDLTVWMSVMTQCEAFCGIQQETSAVSEVTFASSVLSSGIPALQWVLNFPSNTVCLSC